MKKFHNVKKKRKSLKKNLLVLHIKFFFGMAFNKIFASGSLPALVKFRSRCAYSDENDSSNGTNGSIQEVMPASAFKVNPNLGYKVHHHLLQLGIETPYDPLITDSSNENAANNARKIEQITDKFKEIMEILGLDLTNDSLEKTPRRVAKMYVEEVFWGLNPHNFPHISTVKNSMKYDEMVIERNINVSSHCEHHFVHIDGIAHVGYIPKERVIGLSKINRVVRYFSKRPQIQERLTEQIYAALSYVLETQDVAVTVIAQHFCVKCRGIEDVNCNTVTSKLGGIFQTDQKTRGEFIRLIQIPNANCQ
ncbi:GTP cyclohydrolase I [Reticulomyxa filosa]|uniref:GTP cyclohydrolase 1 n=1 Tax=Reticulomyxa filosa TaxID=46433 RepID=X6NAS8_RETFI|nr:GTP cyclohydrolase I [Reticulomyxa filosa]|eukprot:ETO23375.1 GTP cyclohydrolase I [Reticulomyxa filosa]